MEIRLNQPYSFTQLGQRGNQEDARYPDSDEPKGAKPFFVVCDGVGGSNKGEVASRTVCDAFGQALSNTDWSKEFTIRDFEKALDFAFSALEEKTTPENKGMATTLTFVAFHKGGCFIAHIGDSRVYYVRPGEGIVYKTEDHSLVNALVRAGVITQEEAATHPDRNVITRSVCVPEGDQERSTATTVNISDVREGDYVFLCSDGVLKKLTDGRLVDILSASASDKDKRDAIAGLSKDSDDNNTAYLVSVAAVTGEAPIVSVDDSAESSATHVITPIVTPVETSSRHAKPANSKSRMPLIVVGVVAIVAVIAGFFIFQAGFSDNKTETVKEKQDKGNPDLLETFSGDNEEDDSDDVVDKPDTRAEFRGGDKALKAFINDNKNYPDDALKNKKEGTVHVELVIAADGSVKDVDVKQGVCPSLDEEAIRICKQLPKFRPAVDDGHAVASKYLLIIEFRLPKEKEKPAVTAPAANPDNSQQGEVKNDKENGDGKQPNDDKNERNSTQTKPEEKPESTNTVSV